MKRKPIIIVGGIVILGILIFLTGNWQAKKKMVGGPCIYKDYKGLAAITRIAKTDLSKEQVKIKSGSGYEGYEVWFSFISKRRIKEKTAREFAEKEHLFRLLNLWYPGPEYIEKYGIKEGKTYKCTLRVIVKGACTPFIFEFDELKADDYFEAAMQMYD